MVGSTEEGMLRLLNANPPLQLQQSGTASWDGRALPKTAALVSPRQLLCVAKVIYDAELAFALPCHAISFPSLAACFL